MSERNETITTRGFDKLTEFFPKIKELKEFTLELAE